LNVISQIVVSSIDLTHKKDLSDNLKTLGLKEGQSLIAKVTEKLSGNQIKLDVLGNDVTAKTRIPLKPGDTVELIVAKSGSQVSLKIAPKLTMQDSSGSQIQPHLTKLVSLFNSLKSLGREGPFQNINAVIQDKPETGSNFIRGSEQGKSLVKFLDTFSQFQTSGQVKSSEVLNALVKEGNELIRHAANQSPVETSSAKTMAPSPGPETNQKITLTILSALKNLDTVKVAEQFNSQSQGNAQKPGKSVSPAYDLTTPLLKTESGIQKGLISDLNSLKKTASDMVSLLQTNASKSDKGLFNGSVVSHSSKLVQTLESLAGRIMTPKVLEGVEIKSELESILKHVSSPPETLSQEKNISQLISHALKLVHHRKAVNQASALSPELKNLVEQLALKSDKPDYKLLNNLIEKSGLAFENKMAGLLKADPLNIPQLIKQISEKDMKGIALKLLMSTAGEDVNELTGSLKKFVSDMDKLQLVNRSGLDDSGKMMMHIPVAFNEHFKFGQLFIDLQSGRKGSGKNDKPVKVAFLLEMSNLGDIKADFSIYKKYINGSFTVASEETRHKLINAFPDLEKNLLKHEFQVYKLQCHVVPPEELAESSLFDEMQLTDDGVLNLVV